MMPNEKGSANGSSRPHLSVERTSPAVLLARVTGNWRQPATPLGEEMIRQVLSDEPPVKLLEFDTAGLTGWDSRFVALVGKCIEMGRGRDIEVRCEGLPEGVRRLLRMARLLPEKTDARARHGPVKVSFLEKLGERTTAGWEGVVGLFTFLGENLI